MELQQIRNATLKVRYGGLCFLVDPWLQDQGTGLCAPTVRPEMAGLRSPLDPLPLSPEALLREVDFCLVTHIHPDHFTPDYLPRDLELLVQSPADQEKVLALGFARVRPVPEAGLDLGGVRITRTPALHSHVPALAARMGPCSGYVLSGAGERLYLAGDTVLCPAVEETLRALQPEKIVLNCCAATVPEGRLLMDLEEVRRVCALCPRSLVIASHLDSVNHALLDREALRRFAAAQGLEDRLLVPDSGAWLRF